MEELSFQPNSPISSGCLLQLMGIVCAFGKANVVDGIELTIQPGEHVALVGSNGSGKTTLLRAILGLHPIKMGKILLDGREAKTQTDWELRRKKISWMPQRQTTGQFPLLAQELLDSSSSPSTALDAAKSLDIVHLLPRPLNSLSGGQLQRVFLARAIGAVAGGSGLLLADEPTAALDFDGQIKVAEVLRKLTVTSVVVTHDHKMADRCHRVIEMAAGKLHMVTP